MSSKHDFTDASRGQRLQKVLAEAGVGSRRACEQLIEAGLVSVNGQLVATLPAWVNPDTDRIEVDGQRLRSVDRPVYVMLNKPRGVVCTNSDPEGRPLAIELVKHRHASRFYCVGRLDMDSTGLLLLTNDGELANRLTHPRYEMHKTYEVVVRGSLDDEAVAKLGQGLFLPEQRTGRGPGRKTSRSRLELVKRDRDRTVLRMELREGRNRQIRRMMLRVGYPVKRLKRIQMGPLKLKGLSPGHWRDLSAAELGELRRAAFGKTRSKSAV